MPSLDWNITTWNNYKNWSNRGEEWSVAWGGSYAQWYGTILPRISLYLPCNAVLEIAPGFGRWTRFLINSCNEYCGVELSSICVNDLEKLFNKGEFILNDGYSLEDVADNNYDFIFSFDSLVHAERDVIESYLIQIPDKLSENGVAFLHLSNLASLPKNENRCTHAREMSVSSQFIRDFCSANNINLVLQELVNWGGEDLIDQFILIKKTNESIGAPTVIKNCNFMLEADVCKEVYAKYIDL